MGIDKRKPVVYLGACIIGIVLIIVLYVIATQVITLDQGGLIVQFIQVAPFSPIVIFVFIWLFRSEISVFIKNLKSVKTPAFEASTQLQQSEEVEEKIEEIKQKEGITLTEEQAKEIQQIVIQKDQDAQHKDQLIKDLMNLNDYLLVRSETYEFSYLSYFLVENTKRALLWFYDKKHASSMEFLAQFQLYPSLNPDSLIYHYQPELKLAEDNEKNKILEALLSNQLMQYMGDGINITINPKGVKFLKFIGYLK